MSWQLKVMKFLLKRTKRRQQKMRSDLAFVREVTERSLSTMPKATGVSIEESSFGGYSVDKYTVRGHHHDYTLLYLHGGGYTILSAKSHRTLVSKMCQTLEVNGIALDYRLAPEYPYPAALEDTVGMWTYLVEESHLAPESIVLAGDSAGGGLCIALMMRLRDLGMPLPKAAILLSPWTDLTFSTESIHTHARKDPMLTLDFLKEYRQHYIGDGDPANPFVSPLLGNFEGLPPLLIQVGTAEIILDDSLVLGKKARSQGVNVTVEPYPDLPHVFQFAWFFVPEAKLAFKNMKKWWKELLANGC